MEMTKDPVAVEAFACIISVILIKAAFLL